MIWVATALLVVLGTDAKPVASGPSVQGELTKPDVREELVRSVQEEIGAGEAARAYVGETFSTGFKFWGWNPVEVTAEGLPAGARLHLEEPKVGDKTNVWVRNGTLVWTPTREQIGHHRMTFVGSDGRTNRATIDVEITVEDRWESWFLPGVQYVAYFPAGRGEGALHGPSFELVIGSWVHDTKDRGPSHGRVYFDVALLESTRPGGSTGVSYALGTDLSLERNPRRRFLVPLFGMEIGGLQQKQLGGVFQIVPLAGAHLWSDRNVFVTATAGYAFTGRDIERLGGWRVRAGVDLALW